MAAPAVDSRPWGEQFKLSNMMQQEWENGMTGTVAVAKIKELLSAKGCYPPDRDSVPEEWEEALLLRFFIGFKKNPEAAAEAFEAMLAWRKENGINEIRKKLLDGLEPTEHGCPILITLTGLIDPAKLVKNVTLEEMRLYIIYEMESKFIKLCQLTAESGIFYRALEVHDLKGLGMHHLATGPVGLLRKVVKEVSANYVEISDKELREKDLLLVLVEVAAVSEGAVPHAPLVTGDAGPMLTGTAELSTARSRGKVQVVAAVSPRRRRNRR